MSKLIDLTGQIFGRLEVLERVENKGKQVRWLCRCECGIEKIIYGTNLRRGLTQSCGCFRKEKLKEKLIDLKGKNFGRLIVLKMYRYSQEQREYFWICQCQCGSIVNVSGTHLKSGHTQSCGCLISKGEEKISQLLVKNNISFVKNKTNGLALSTGGLARFDFTILKNNQVYYYIEYDGWQHFIKKNTKWDKENRFEQRQENDRSKNQYCLDNSIPLIRIPYTHYDKLVIEDLVLSTSDFIIKE